MQTPLSPRHCGLGAFLDADFLPGAPLPAESPSPPHPQPKHPALRQLPLKGLFCLHLALPRPHPSWHSISVLPSFLVTIICLLLCLPHCSISSKESRAHSMVISAPRVPGPGIQQQLNKCLLNCVQAQVTESNSTVRQCYLESATLCSYLCPSSSSPTHQSIHFNFNKIRSPQIKTLTQVPFLTEQIYILCHGNL
jgi:hypothetical protein